MTPAGNARKRVLVLGGSGNIGLLVVEALLPNFDLVATTTSLKKLSQNMGNLAFLDKNQNLSWIEVDLLDLDFSKFSFSGSGQEKCLEKFSYIVICSGGGGKRYCEDEPIKSRVLNVLSIKKVLETVADSSTYVVFCSTDLLEVNREPRSAYENQKLELENYVAHKFKQHLFLRFGKILDHKDFIGCRWLEQIRLGMALDIKPELTFSPVLKIQVLTLFSSLLANAPTGKVLVSAGDEWSYALLARWLRNRQSLIGLEQYLHLTKKRHIGRFSEIMSTPIASTEEILKTFFSELLKTS